MIFIRIILYRLIFFGLLIISKGSIYLKDFNFRVRDVGVYLWFYYMRGWGKVIRLRLYWDIFF